MVYLLRPRTTKLARMAASTATGNQVVVEAGRSGNSSERGQGTFTCLKITLLIRDRQMTQSPASYSTETREARVGFWEVCVGGHCRHSLHRGTGWS